MKAHKPISKNIIFNEIYDNYNNIKFEILINIIIV